MRKFVVALLFFISADLHAEQLQTFGVYDVHYVVLPTTFLKAEIAAKYDLARSENRALVNVSVLDADDQPVPARVTGRSANLLGQGQVLEFTEVREGPAVYYLALLRHGDEDIHRIALDVTLPNGRLAEIRFQQKMYQDE